MVYTDLKSYYLVYITVVKIVISVHIFNNEVNEKVSTGKITIG